MAEVTLEVRRADGTPAPAKVRVDLWGAGETVAGTVVATSERVVSPLVTYADGKRTESPQVGRVVLTDLVPNADIEPTGTVWRIQLGDQDPEHYIVDGEGNLTPTDPPGSIESSALASHEADTTGIHGIADTAALVVTTDPRLTDARTPTAHAATHATGGSDPITPAAIGAIPTAEKGAANGVATLTAAGVVPSAQMPPIAITDTFVVASQAAMLALDAQRGDVAVRSDLDPDGVFLLTADNPTILANWVQITAPGSVLSVDGRTGTVTLADLYAASAHVHDGSEVFVDTGNSGTAKTLTWTQGTVQRLTLTGNCTLTLTGAVNNKGCSLTIIIIQDATGGRSITWPASVRWPGGVAAGIGTAANAVSLVTLLTVDGGTTWRGMLAGASFQ